MTNKDRLRLPTASRALATVPIECRCLIRTGIGRHHSYNQCSRVRLGAYLELW